MAKVETVLQLLLARATLGFLSGAAAVEVAFVADLTSKTDRAHWVNMQTSGLFGAVFEAFQGVSSRFQGIMEAGFRQLGLSVENLVPEARESRTSICWMFAGASHWRHGVALLAVQRSCAYVARGLRPLWLRWRPTSSSHTSAMPSRSS